MNLLFPVFVVGAVLMATGTASARRRRDGGFVVPLPSSGVFTDCPLESYGFSSTVADRIRQYAGTVESAAFDFDIDPNLLMGQVMVESTWDPSAESGAGAVGLLQIMPKTAEWISEQSGLPNNRRDPYHNLRMGAWLIRYLYERWDENLDLALAAYFAGSGNVQKALDQTGTLSPAYANYVEAVLDKQEEFAAVREFCAREAA